MPRRWIYFAKGIRLFALGIASIALPIHLASDLSSLWIGAVLTLTLLSGALQMLVTGALIRRFGDRSVTLAAACLMALGGLLAATNVLWFVVLGAAIGAVNAAAQEIGPFLPFEQANLAAGDYGVRRMALYNAVGTAALALGTFAGGVLHFRTAFLLYTACGAALVIAYYRTTTPRKPILARRVSRARRFGTAERLAAFFAVDAFAGGLVVQGFLAYWLLSRYHAQPQAIGIVLAAGNVLSAFSLFAAAGLAKRFGLLNTMVFTHLPSNVLLALVPLAPSFPIAAALLLARYSLSQMDVPTRQAFVVSLVPEDEQIHAAGITSAVRPLAAAASPVLATFAMQAAAIGAPFFAAGGIKAAYDIAVYLAFRRAAETPARQP